MTNKQIPLILKMCLDAKPWESQIVDVINVWKFNGYDYMTLMMIAEFMGLKKTVDLLPNDELSKWYWENIENSPEETIDFMVRQSANHTNLVIKFMYEMRQL